MFWGVRCWDPEELTPKLIREAGLILNLPPQLIEREVVFYDTLEALINLSPNPLILKEDTVISRIYSDKPRFSWDINLSTSLAAKRDYDVKALNIKLESLGGARRLMLGSYVVEVGFVERDVEKDVFTDVLALKRDMATISLGTHLPTYLRKLHLPLDKLSRELTELKKALGSLPFIESVRATIYINEFEAPSNFNRINIPSFIERALKPNLTVKALAYPPEYCLIEKISRISKPLEEIGLRDMLCDFYDIGQLINRRLKKEALMRRYKQLYATRLIPDVNMLRRRLNKNLSTIKENIDSFKKRREFIWIKDSYDWLDYYNSTAEKVKAVLEELI